MNKNKILMSLAATTISVTSLMGVQNVQASELSLKSNIEDKIMQSVALEAAKHVEVEDVAEVYTNIDKFYTAYAKDFVGIETKSVSDLNLLEKKVIIQIDLNKVSENFSKTLPKENPLTEVISVLKDNPDYLQELKTLSSETKQPLLVEQVIKANLTTNKFEIGTTLKMGELYGQTEYDDVDMLRYTTKKSSFKDISNHWGKEDIISLAEIGIIAGYDDGTFKPNNNVTRGQFAAMLARTIPNADLQNVKSKFTDISSHWAKNDIILLNQLGIVDGVNASTFNPNAPITRQQAAKVLVRYVEVLGIDIEDIPTELKFADTNKISSYAKEPVGKLYNLGIISGSTVNGKQVFNPSGNLTRAQMSKMLNGLLETNVNSFDK